MIERYARARVLADDAWGQVPDELVSPGSHGGLVQDPAAVLALKADAEAARYGQCLGLEPQAPAKQVGRPKGSVSAPDRRVASSPPKVLRVVS